MKNSLLLLLISALLLSCNVIVTTPAQPQLCVAVDNLPGRWHNVGEDGTPRAGEYLEVSPVQEKTHYKVAIYETGEADGVYRISLCPTEKADSYWGFARDQELSGGFRLFHLEIGEQEARLRWLDEEKTEALMVSAGLPFESERNARFSPIKIHATWSQLLETLNADGVDVLDSDMTRFRRGRAVEAAESIPRPAIEPRAS